MSRNIKVPCVTYAIDADKTYRGDVEATKLRKEMIKSRKEYQDACKIKEEVLEMVSGRWLLLAELEPSEAEKIRQKVDAGRDMPIQFYENFIRYYNRLLREDRVAGLRLMMEASYCGYKILENEFPIRP